MQKANSHLHLTILVIIPFAYEQSVSLSFSVRGGLKFQSYTGGWFSTPQVRMHLDIAVGEAKVDEQGEKGACHRFSGKG